MLLTVHYVYFVHEIHTPFYVFDFFLDRMRARDAEGVALVHHGLGYQIVGFKGFFLAGKDFCIFSVTLVVIESRFKAALLSLLSRMILFIRLALFLAVLTNANCWLSSEL